MLTPQQILCLGIIGQDCNVTTVIGSGDFCALIADEAGISEDTLMANNPNVDEACDNIYLGEVRSVMAARKVPNAQRRIQVLCTASTVIPYTS